MDSYQLRYALIKSLKIFTAVCAENQLKSIKPGKTFGIIVNNLPSSKEGMHWVCFYKSEESSSVEFFDSFGLGIHYYPKSLVNFCKRQGSSITQSKIQYQSNLSDVCGNFCVWFLNNRHKKTSFPETLALLSSTDRSGNDKLVQEFTAQNFTFPKFSDCKEECVRLCAMKNMPFSEVCYQKGKKCFKIQSMLFEK